LSQEEPSVGRVVIEDTDDPVSIRFLHVLQGANAEATQDGVAHVASTGGNAFEGITVRGVAVMFPVNVLSNDFTSVTYLAPVGITNHYIAGLAANAGYTVTQITLGGAQHVTVTPGGNLIADSAGLLSFTPVGQTLSSAPSFLSAQWFGSNLQLVGTGMANLTYSILSSTNLASAKWMLAGTVTADINGNFQFTDTNAWTSLQGFYRVSWP
jgi:hypothetical protein